MARGVDLHGDDRHAECARDPIAPGQLQLAATAEAHRPHSLDAACLRTELLCRDKIRLCRCVLDSRTRDVRSLLRVVLHGVDGGIPAQRSHPAARKIQQTSAHRGGAGSARRGI